MSRVRLSFELIADQSAADAGHSRTRCSSATTRSAGSTARRCGWTATSSPPTPGSAPAPRGPTPPAPTGSARPSTTPPPAPSSNNDIVVTGQRLCEKLQPVGGGVAQSPDPQAPIEVIGRRLHPTPPIVVTAPRPAVPLLIPAAAFNGLSFCPNARLGSSNFFFPNGRIVSRKSGGASAAINDIDSIASANGLDPLGTDNAWTVIAAQLNPWFVPWPVGGGWWVSKNFVSGDVSTANSGLTLRTNPATGKLNVDIPGGFRLPSGGILPLDETCHYGS